MRAGAQRLKFLLTARPCEPSVGGDGRRRRAPTNAAAVGVMWRVLGPDIVRIAADVPFLRDITTSAKVGCPQDQNKKGKKKWGAPDRSTSCWLVEILRV